MCRKTDNYLKDIFIIRFIHHEFHPNIFKNEFYFPAKTL
jgi:hypothetical protein